MTDTLHEQCARCGVIGQDRRTLYMACLYEMLELGVPFVPVGVHGARMAYVGRDERFGFPTFKEVPEAEARTHPFYTLRVCKGCRGAWLEAIVHWFRNPVEPYLSLNDDENLPKHPALSDLLADAERLRTDLIAIQSRVDALLPDLRTAHDTWDKLRGAP